jgi:hypothetical protein
MTDDLIRDNFCVEVDKNAIIKNIRLIKIVLAVVSLYLTMGAYLWMKVFITKPAFMKAEGIKLFENLLTPIVLFATVLINLMAIVLCLKGNRLIQASFAQNDASLFNYGYKQFYRSGILSLITISISLLHGLLNIFIF